MAGLRLSNVVAWSFFFALVAASPVPVPEPIRCAPCTQEMLNRCPPVSTSTCPEVLKEPGCGCCLACALALGEACGVYTAHCGSGLRCVPPPNDPRPLHSLTRGRGVCVAEGDWAQGGSPPNSEPSPQRESEKSNWQVVDSDADELQNVMLKRNNLPTEDDGDDAGEEQSSLRNLLALNKPLDPDAQESLKAKVNAIRKKLLQLGPCHTELHAALDSISTSQQELGEKFTSFYLPNCDKHGFYKAKQCETSLVGQPARCWCVSPWNGKRIAGSSDLGVDALCNQEVTH